MCSSEEILTPDRVLGHGQTVTGKSGVAGVEAEVETANRGETERTDDLAAGPQ